MLTEVASFLNRRGETDLIGQAVVITDSCANGEFLIHHFITQALKDDHTTVLVSFAQSFTHYNSIATKLGVNLAKYIELGNLMFVDCLTKLLPVQRTGRSVEEDNHLCQTQPNILFSLDSTYSLCGLFDLLQQTVRQASQKRPGKPVCLVMDDLSVLLSVGVQLVEVVGLVHYCRQLTISGGILPESSGYIVTMVHCESGEGMESEESLARHLIHSCHLSLHVEGLSSGYSKDVHGQLTATWRRRVDRHSPLLPKETHFKLSDRTVHLFAKGTSSAVL